MVKVDAAAELLENRQGEEVRCELLKQFDQYRAAVDQAQSGAMDEAYGRAFDVLRVAGKNGVKQRHSQVELSGFVNQCAQIFGKAGASKSKARFQVGFTFALPADYVT